METIIKAGIAAVLGLAVILMVNSLGNDLTATSFPEKPAYMVSGEKAEGEEAAEAEEAPTFEELLAAADPAKGKKVSKKCAACHTFEEGGKAKTGPNLYGIVGKAKASSAGFNYSDALQGLGGDWTVEDLDAFLTKPKDFAPGTKMAFAGLKKAKDRAAMIVYLQSMQ